VVMQALQLLAAANAPTDSSSVSEPMRRALVKSVSAQMSTEDPQRLLLDFSSVLLAALQPGSSRNRTVVKVIYKVSFFCSSNDPLFAARPRLLQLMAEVVQASADLDAVLYAISFSVLAIIFRRWRQVHNRLHQEHIGGRKKLCVAGAGCQWHSRCY
jgi:hypothetical protein